MGKRKRRGRAHQRNASPVTANDGSPPAGAQGDSGKLAQVGGRKPSYATIAVVATVIVVLVVLVVGQIRPSSGSLTASAQPARGKVLFEKNCVSCHGAEGRGQPGWKNQARAAPPLDSSAHAWHHDDAQLVAMILDKPAPDSLMPAWRGVLTREDTLDVLAYVKSLWTPYIRENCQGVKHTNCMTHQ
jgi:mono/diheme cytochrome c family protein